MEQSTIAILIITAAVISFALEKIPLAMTAILAALAMGIFGIIKPGDVYANFGSLAAVMVASMMVVGNAAFENGLAQAMGKGLRKMGLGKNQRTLIFILVTLSIILSAFLSNSAVVAMFIPLLASIVVKSQGKVENKYVLMAVGMGASAGGFCTLAGSTPQMVAQGILIETDGLAPMKFFDLALAGIPLCIIMIIYFATAGYALEKKVLTFQDVIPGMEGETDTKEKQYSKGKQRITGVVLIGCIAGFIVGIWDLAVVALLGASILITTGCISFKKAFESIDWNTIVILAASQGFAKGLDSSGAGALIAEKILDLFGGPEASAFVVMAALFIVTALLTNFMSNVAVASMIIPIGLSLALSLGVRPETFVIGITLACQLATATPIGSPCVTQTLVGGYRYMDYVKIGLPVTLLQLAALIVLVPVIYGF